MNLAAYRMDGIILSSVNEGEEYREFLGSLGMPIVSVDQPDCGWNSICDHRSARSDEGFCPVCVGEAV